MLISLSTWRTICMWVLFLWSLLRNSDIYVRGSCVNPHDIFIVNISRKMYMWYSDIFSVNITSKNNLNLSVFPDCSTAMLFQCHQKCLIPGYIFESHSVSVILSQLHKRKVPGYLIPAYIFECHSRPALQTEDSCISYPNMFFWPVNISWQTFEELDRHFFYHFS